MNDTGKSEDLGRLSPAQVVRCAEGSSTVCWIRAEATAEDGTTTSYECCGGGGQKPSFTIRTSFLSPKSVGPDEIPDGLLWSRRTV